MAPSDPNAIVDDKSPICIPFILERLVLHQQKQKQQQQYESQPLSSSERDNNNNDTIATPREQPKPFIVGLNGVQGVGKTTLVSALADTLQHEHGIETLVCSIDDFYLRRKDQQKLADSDPDNKLLQVRGEPGTHDMRLAAAFFSALCASRPVKVPEYDKSAHSGKGDRVPESAWKRTVNSDPARPVQVVICEGWCVGFRSLDRDEVESKYAVPGTRTLKDHKLEHLLKINESLKAYDTAITALFDAFVHIDAENTEWVYDWRLEQEVKLRRDKGTGMTDEEVVRFVDAYYPAYELFCDKLRSGLLPENPGSQLRIIVGRDRKVREVIIL